MASLVREEIISELWRILYGVTGVVRVVRNPDVPPNLDDLPCIHLLELTDTISDRSSRGGTPSYKRKLLLAIEVFVDGDTEDSASKDLLIVVNSVKQTILADPTLGRRCLMEELDCTAIERIPGGSHVRALGIGFQVLYTEKN
jgi:hypothetical protein